VSRRLRFGVALLAAWGLVLAALAVVAAFVAADLAPGDLAALLRIVQARAPHAIVALLLLLAPLALILQALFRRYVDAPRALAHDARIMLTAYPAHRAALRGSAEMKGLAREVNALADARSGLQEEVDQRIHAANAQLEEERTRLAALMSELAQSVVMCNVEGRILLYNARAMRLLVKPLEGQEMGKGPSLVGLGRSVFAIFDRNLIIHALETVQDRLRQDAPNPIARFVTAVPSGALVRVQMAPVLAGEAGAMDPGITGFVLVLDDITRRTEAGNRRDRLLQTLTQGTRASLGSVRAAVETIIGFPDMSGEERHRFLGVISDEARELSTRLDASLSEFADSLHSEWPLEEMRGADLIAAARRRIEAKTGLLTKLEAVDETVWLKIDSYSLMQAIAYVASRLADEFGIRELRFGLAVDGALAHLDLIWSGAPLGFETTMAWQTDAMDLGGEPSPLTLKGIVERHNGEIWYQIHKPSQVERFRIALPLAQPEESPWAAPAVAKGRPEFYDFDLFHQPGQTREQDDRPLASLAYTVFDTETTGLAPSAGDEIVSIGAVRIVNGRLLTHEVFEQLVDPVRAMPAEASRITGIDATMLDGQPVLAKVLPAFHEFCRYGADRAQCGVRPAVPEAQGGGDRHSLRPPGARHAAPLGRHPPGLRAAQPGSDRRSHGRESDRPAHGAGRRHHDR